MLRRFSVISNVIIARKDVITSGSQYQDFQLSLHHGCLKSSSVTSHKPDLTRPQRKKNEMYQNIAAAAAVVTKLLFVINDNLIEFAILSLLVQRCRVLVAYPESIGLTVEYACIHSTQRGSG